MPIIPNFKKCNAAISALGNQRMRFLCIQQVISYYCAYPTEELNFSSPKKNRVFRAFSSLVHGLLLFKYIELTPTLTGYPTALLFPTSMSLLTVEQTAELFPKEFSPLIHFLSSVLFKTLSTIQCQIKYHLFHLTFPQDSR